jgi:hypothetical protein
MMPGPQVCTARMSFSCSAFGNQIDGKASLAAGAIIGLSYIS